ncbi:MAG: glycoside hydrolase family 27 protein [Clostridia bacterium]|nr:glycoside hydrolase family 27 protein [Clostridia bacterium]
MNKRIALTPPMGWNSWDCYGDSVNEAQLKANADYMAKNLKKYGYEYIVCDIQWSEPTADGYAYHDYAPLCMDEFSRLIPAVERFPSAKDGKGFGPIADYIHSLGLKFGIHIMRGIPRQAVKASIPIKCDGITAADIANTESYCPWNTDMYGVNVSAHGAKEYYDSLFELYASWGVDFVKCDDIANTEFNKEDPYSARKEIELIRSAIDSCGRNIVLSLSPGPAPVEEHAHLAQNAEMWRISGDFWDSWDKLYDMFGRCLSWQAYVKPGAWPDCDMLPVGRLQLCDNDGVGRESRFTHDEIKTMMSLWCIFRSPLMIGSELSMLDDFTLSVLTNSDVLEMSKKSFNGRQTVRNEDNGKGEIIWQSNGENCRYTALFNTDDKIRNIGFYKGDETVWDMWEHKYIDTDGFVSVSPHGVALLKLEKKNG